MKRIAYSIGILSLLAIMMVSCQKAGTADPNAITADERSLVASAGFNSNWFEKPLMEVIL